MEKIYQYDELRLQHEVLTIWFFTSSRVQGIRRYTLSLLRLNGTQSFFDIADGQSWYFGWLTRSGLRLRLAILVISL